MADDYLIDPNTVIAPVESVITVTWGGGAVTRKFTLDDIQAMSEGEYRLFQLACMCGNVDDPRFVEAFKPAPDEPVPDADWSELRSMEG